MEHLLQKTPIQRTIREYLMIVLALFPFALMVNWIFVPQNVVGAGLTGICSITSFPFHFLANLPKGQFFQH